MIESTYSKLFHCILTSSVWQEDDATRLIWITFLALKNRFGEVSGSIPGIAHAAKVPIKDTEAAIKKLLTPDKYSRSKEFDGRRIEEIPGGWRVLNHAKYRDAMNEDDRREYKARWQRERRAALKAKGKNEDRSGQTGTSVTHTDTDANAPKHFPNRIVVDHDPPLEPEEYHKSHCDCFQCRQERNPPDF